MLATIVISLILISLIVTAFKSIKNSGGCSSCSGNCSHCSKVNQMKTALAKAKQSI